MKRIASICLPVLAIERWSRFADAPEAPVALVVEAAHGQLIHAVTPAAAERGAHPGMRLTDARALDPKLLAEPADPAGDAALLKRLARWAGRWSPLVEVDGEDGLRLDVSGVAHLFGGEEGLATDIRSRFGALGLTACTAIAPTAGAAWALARFSPRVVDKDVAKALAPLPVAALRLDARSIQILERLGLKTIGQLAKVPRKSLQRRFREADNPLNALDRALGLKDEPLTGERIELPPRVLAKLSEPATHPEAAGQALGRLVPGLARQLQDRKLGARRLHLAGYRVDGSVAGTGVATAIPTRDPKHLMRLLIDKATVLDPEFGFDAFALTASWCEPLGATQESLVDEPSGEAEVAKLVDRLSVKLGPQRVRRPQPIASHLPERANGWRLAVEERPSPQLSPASGRGSTRPQHLLDRPEAIAVVYATPEGLPRRFVWRRLVHDIAKAEGPERIAPEWWRERSTARLRDYYRVEDKDGRRYWIFREGLVGDGRGGAPEWYLHGLFG
ncbi:DNA polymerase Y family protein [Sphingomonas alba]|uniref:DNA polymerase Y family protein n=1 Tax=Sphingomonas alba TaxID=2908208 RepID=A0ABT0RMT6_9SPHN|nr:DNA polymerase Y family protein [Sphingomonas alba]MCL6683951.1 DNA polymerase Y family protein [Sphingomonas alba]